MEVLLILSFQNHNIENEIIDAFNKYYYPLEQIIKKAQNSNVLSLTPNTKKDLSIINVNGKLKYTDFRH